MVLPKGTLLERLRGHGFGSGRCRLTSLRDESLAASSMSLVAFFAKTKKVAGRAALKRDVEG
jgi:hypothetical protein